MQLELPYISKLLVSSDDFNHILVMIYMLTVWHAASESTCSVLRGGREDNMTIISNLM